MSRALPATDFDVTLFTRFTYAHALAQIFRLQTRSGLLNAHNRFLFAQHGSLQRSPIVEVE